MTTPVKGPQGDDKRPAHVDLALKAAERVFKQFSDKHGVTIDKLGPAAKKIADEMFKLFEAGAKRDGQVISELVISAYQQLRHAHELDQAGKLDVGKPPAPAKPTDGVIPTTKFLVSAGEGRFKLEGTVGAEHLLSQLLALVGLNPKSFSERVADVIVGAQSSPTFKNLTDEKVWTELARKLRSIAVEEGASGGPGLEAVRRAISNAAQSSNGKQKIDANLGVVPKQGLGLEQTASKTSNTGSQTNSTAIRAQLLAGIKTKETSVDKVADSLASAIFTDLGIDKVSNELRGQVLSALKEVLKDPRSADGSVRPSVLLANAFGALAERVPDDQPKRAYGLAVEFANALTRALEAQPAMPGVEKACSELALTAITELAGVVLGKATLGPSASTMRKLTSILANLDKKNVLDGAAQQILRQQTPPAAKKTEAPKAEDGKTEAPKAEPGKTDGKKRASGADSVDPAEVARTLLQSVGANPDHPRAAALVEALGQIYAKGSHPGSVALNALRWVTEKSGMSPSFLQQAEVMIAQYARGMKTCETKIAEFKAELEGYQAQKGKPQDKNAAGDLDACIASATQRIEEMEKYRSDFDASFKVARDKALSFVAHFTLAPDNFKAQYVGDGTDHGATGQTATGGVNGTNGSNGSNGSNGTDGPVDLFPPRDQPLGRLPGIFSPAGPGDDPSKMTLQEARAAECARILRDGSLSIEDKIFLFMMMFVAFTDREREDQLEEIVGLDRDQARRAKLKDDKTREKTSMLVEQRKATDELRDAEGQRDALRAGGDTPAFQAAQKKVDDLTQKVGACKGRVEEISREYEKIKRDSDKAPQSREVKFTELQRLSQLRDNILNMARSMMETSNRNIEKVFR